MPASISGRWPGLLPADLHLEMVIVALADVTAFGIYMGLWYPDVPR